MTRRLLLLLAAAMPAMAANPANGKELGNPAAPLRLELFSDFT